MSLDKADELIALTTKLAVLIEQDIATLKGNRPSALAQNEGDRAVLLAHYGKAVAAFKATPMTAVATDLKQRLKTATERLHKGMKEQQRLLARFRRLAPGDDRADRLEAILAGSPAEKRAFPRSPRGFRRQRLLEAQRDRRVGSVVGHQEPAALSGGSDEAMAFR